MKQEQSFVAFVLIIIGFILITGKTFGETLGKFFSSIWNFMKKQWFGFLEDMKNWKQEQQKKREERMDQKQEEKEKRIGREVRDEHSYPCCWTRDGGTG